MRLTLLFAFILFFSDAIYSFELEFNLPDGFRYPENSDYTEDDLMFIQDNLPFKIEADFDGNGENDIAVLLVRSDNSGWSVFVLMSHNNSKPALLKLDETKQNVPYLNMGISRLSPGKHLTVAGKGYDCPAGEPKSINLVNPGINYFVFESSDSVFYWDIQSNSFNHVWLSD